MTNRLLAACFVDPVDQRISVRVDDGEGLGDAGPGRPAHDGLVRIGVDDGDAFALIGEDCRNENGGRRFSRHGKALPKAKRFRKLFRPPTVAEP